MISVSAQCEDRSLVFDSNGVNHCCRDLPASHSKQLYETITINKTKHFYVVVKN